MGPHLFPRAIVPNPADPTAVDFRAFYPYTPNEVKHRKRTTSQQLKVLEAVFKKDTKPNAALRTELAQELTMTPRGVQVWFQNRRAKEKTKSAKLPKHDDEPPQLSLITDPDALHPPPDTPTHTPSTQPPSPSPPRTSSPSAAALSPCTPSPSSSPIPSSAAAPSMPVSTVSPPTSTRPSPEQKTPPSTAPASASHRPPKTRSASTPPPRPAPQSRLVPRHAPLRLSQPHPRPRQQHPQTLHGLPRREVRPPPPPPADPLSLSPSPPTTPSSAPLSQTIASTPSPPAPSSPPSPAPPVPGFQFGAASSGVASSIPSPSSGDSERNSPDSLRSFSFRTADDDDALTSPTFEAYPSRFGSIASIATSESSINSAYYAELGGSAVNHMERRHSCANPQFLGMLSDLDVGSRAEHVHHPSAMPGAIELPLGDPVAQDLSAAYSIPFEYPYSSPEQGVEIAVAQNELHMQEQQIQQQHYGASPASTGTVTHNQSPAMQDAVANVPISSSSELAFALESKQPMLEQKMQHIQPEIYVDYGHPEPQSLDLQSHPLDANFFPPQVQQHHDPSVGYPSAYDYQQDHQQAQLAYDYSEPLASGAVLDNGLQSVDAFVAYT